MNIRMQLRALARNFRPSLLAFAAAPLLITPNLMSAQDTPGVIRVSGQATVKAVPEVMVVDIPITVKNDSYSACSDELMASFKRLKAALVKAGIDEKLIYSNGLRISENYEYDSGKRILKGFEGNIQALVKTENNTKTLQSISGVMANDAFNFGYSLRYELSEKQKEALRDEAMKRAVQEAKANATALGAGLDLKLGQVLEISYEVNEYAPGPLVRNYMMKAEASGDSSDLELNPQEQELSKQVTVVWQVLPI